MARDTFGVFSYAGMPYDEAERSLRLFAREVKAALKALAVEAARAAAAIAAPGV